MIFKRWLLFFGALALLSGCAAYPKTIAEYRQMHRDHPNFPGGRHETFEVARPLGDVAQSVKKKANECLNATYKYSERTNTSFSSGIKRFQAHSTIAANGAEIYATLAYLNNDGKERDRIFMFLLDLKPIAKNKTKAELFYSWGEPIPRTAKAVRLWATGQDPGCPNLTAS